MLSRIVYSTYCAGVLATSSYGLYLSSKEVNLKLPKTEGFIYSLMWPLAVIGNTISTMDEIDIITKNN